MAPYCIGTQCVNVMIVDTLAWNRDQFVALHSSPILENLSHFFLRKFAHIPSSHMAVIKTATSPKENHDPPAERGARAHDLTPADSGARALSSSPRPPAKNSKSYSLAEIEARKRELLFRQVPAKGSLDLNVVKDSVYFFS